MHQQALARYVHYHPLHILTTRVDLSADRLRNSSYLIVRLYWDSVLMYCHSTSARLFAKRGWLDLAALLLRQKEFTIMDLYTVLTYFPASEQQRVATHILSEAVAHELLFHCKIEDVKRFAALLKIYLDGLENETNSMTLKILNSVRFRELVPVLIESKIFGFNYIISIIRTHNLPRVLAWLYTNYPVKTRECFHYSEPCLIISQMIDDGHLELATIVSDITSEKGLYDALLKAAADREDMILIDKCLEHVSRKTIVETISLTISLRVETYLRCLL